MEAGWNTPSCLCRETTQSPSNIIVHAGCKKAYNELLIITFSGVRALILARSAAVQKVYMSRFVLAGRTSVLLAILWP